MCLEGHVTFFSWGLVFFSGEFCFRDSGELSWSCCGCMLPVRTHSSLQQATAAAARLCLFVELGWQPAAGSGRFMVYLAMLWVACVVMAHAETVAAWFGWTAVCGSVARRGWCGLLCLLRLVTIVEGVCAPQPARARAPAPHQALQAGTLSGGPAMLAWV